MLMATFESKGKDFFNIPSKKADYFELKREENNLGKEIAETIFKDLKEKNKTFLKRKK